MSGLTEAPKKEGGCGLLIMAGGVLSVGYMIYWFLSGGDPEVKRFRNDCYHRETRQYLPGSAPDDALDVAVAKCERELRIQRGLQP
jgi:hypothetical protein